MQRVALIELRSDEGLLPSVLSDYFGAISSERIKGDLCLTQTSASPSDLLCAKREFRNRIAIGAEEIWELFPESRVIFTAVVERVTLAGKIVAEIPLGDVVVGDRLIGESIFLYDSIGMRAPPTQFATKEKLDVSKIDLADFSFLTTKKSQKQYCINGKEIIFCRIFSISDCEDQLFPGFYFIYTRELIENSDYKVIFNNINELRRINGKYINTIDEKVLANSLPTDISGAFIFDPKFQKDREFRDAVIGRVFAAAAIADGLSGEIVAELKLSHQDGETELSFKPRLNENWVRPYIDHSLPWRNVISRNHPIFKEIMSILGNSTSEKYVKASDDFRLIAIDIVEDGRHSRTPAVRYAQLWMGIERLISSQGETSVQLAIALCALFPSSERTNQFKKIRSSYAHRSNIVHGYKFRRNQPLHIDEKDLSSLFRALLWYSITSSTKDETELRSTLIEHVISGAPSEIVSEAKWSVN